MQSTFNKFGGGAHGIARVISKRGYCSRSKAEMLVKEGRVTLNGKVVVNPETPTRENDEIVINGKSIKAAEKLYFMMNKPKGYVTTASDEKNRPTVIDLFNEKYRHKYAHLQPNQKAPHISPVGRLDCASEGLLLLSNDTQWANEILDPKNSHIKIFRVQTKGILSEVDLKKLVDGFMVPARIFGEKEEFMKAKSAAIHNVGEKNCWLQITLTEGKNRQIRRMLDTLGYPVLRLIRIQINNYQLGQLKPGEIESINSK